MALLRRASGLILLALSALTLLLLWDRLPERWIVHWGRGGVPNGWATRTPLSVFMPLALGAAIWTFLELLAAAVERMGRIPEVDRATATLIRTVAFALAAMFAGLALFLPLAQPQRSEGIVVVALAIVTGGLARGLVRFSRQVWALKQKGVAGLEHWTGLLYRNPSDERLWVPKISGLGYTLNFAKPIAWVILVALLLPPVLIALVAFASR